MNRRMDDRRGIQGDRSRESDPVRLSLARIRGFSRAFLIASAVSLLSGAVLAAVAGLGLADFALRTPAAIRLALLALGLVALTWAVVRVLMPAFRFRPSLTEIALRVERSEMGCRAGLPGVLASALELADPASPADDLQRTLAAELSADARGRFASVRASAILAPATMLRSLAWFVAVLAAVLALAAARPELAAIGAKRILTPWAGVEWPRRTALADATLLTVQPDDETLPLRVLLTRTNRAPGETAVAARYRTIGPVGPGPTQRVLMRSQLRNDVAPTPDGAVEGELFERLVEPAARELTADGTQAWIEYWFETEDERTEPRRILLARRPAVESASAAVSPPAYAERAAGGVLAGAVPLGRGADERAVLSPILAGSRVDLEVALNKPVPPPEGWESGATERVIRRSFILDATERVPLTLIDRHGLASAEEPVFTLEVVPDAPPGAVVTEPPRDETVLSTALVPVAGEGRDDVGVAWAAVEHQHARPPAGSVGAPPEPVAPPLRAAELAWTDAMPREARVQTTLDLATLGLRPGDELWITALAADAYSASGAERAPTRSAPRRLRIISEAELMEQVRAELAALRRAAIQLDAEQAAAQRQTETLGPTDDAARRQASLPERIAQQRRAVDMLAERVRRNALDDPSLSGTLDDADGLLADASDAAREAARALETERRRLDAAREAGDAAEPDERAMGAIAEEQARTRDNLSALIEMLDRGEDAWVARRTLERLIADQREITDRTRRLGNETVGRELSELSAQQRAELERIVEAQREAAQRAQQAIDELSERARQLERADPAQAQAMRDAATRGRQEQVADRLEDAADQAEQNRMQTAAEQQQRAAESLQRMLDDVENAQRNRDEALRRVLASVIESLEALIVRQERALASLEEAVPLNAFEGLDSGMLALHLNTLSVLDQITTAQNDLAAVASLVEEAARAQESAVVALRRSPVDADAAREHEQLSLNRLVQAKEEAERADREAAERDATRQRSELRAAYRELLEQQATLLAETEPFVGAELTRRDRAVVRGIGERQDAVRARLVELRDQTEGLADTIVVEYAHSRLESATSAAAQRLRAGEADTTVTRNQAAAVRLLRSLVEALNEAQQERDFREQEQDSGGEGGGQSGGSPPLIPPIAELRILREMQQEAADWTRELDADARPDPGEKARLAELQRELATRGEALVQAVMQQAPPQHPQPQQREGQR